MGVVEADTHAPRPFARPPLPLLCIGPYVVPRPRRRVAVPPQRPSAVVHVMHKLPGLRGNECTRQRALAVPGHPLPVGHRPPSADSEPPRWSPTNINVNSP